MIYGLTGLYVCAHQIKLHRIPAESLPVKGIKFFRNVMIAELRVEQISRGNQGHHARIARILGEPQIVSDGASVLSRFVVGPESCSSGNACRAVKFHSLFHENIQNTGRKNAAKSTAFQNQTCLHKNPS